MRNKKRAIERRLSESENSETEERDKYKIDQKNTEVSETVKPILNREKQSAHQTTANIEIKKGRSDDNCSLPKRKSSIEEEIVDGNRMDSPIDAAKEAVKAEFKNDLIFDLDM